MTDWKMVAQDLRAVLSRHAIRCDRCSVDNNDMVMISDRCREGAMLLSEVVIADVHAEVQDIKRMHGCG